jgi:hypothetical protein
MREFLDTPIAVLVVGIFAVFGVICVVIAIIGKFPRIQLTGKGSLSSFEIKGRKVYALALFGIALIAGAATLASYSPAADITKIRQELLSTITVQETKIAEPTSTPRVEQITEQVIVTQIVVITSTPVPTPAKPPYSLDLKDWQTDFCDDKCGMQSGVSASSIIAPIVPGRNYEAIEVIYEVRNSGWVLIKKEITPDVLAGTKGLSFFYKGIGQPNSIEFKLLLRYPGDPEDTTFGVIWARATDTGDQWKSHEALYDVDFKCWGPSELCEKHGNVFDMESVHRIEFGISNKAGDTAGLGNVSFTEVAGIPR